MDIYHPAMKASRMKQEEGNGKGQPERDGGFLSPSRRTIIMFWAKLSVVVIGLGWGTAKAGVTTLLWVRGQDLAKLEERIKLGEDFLKERDREISKEFREELARTRSDILEAIRETEKTIRQEMRQWREYTSMDSRAAVYGTTLAPVPLPQ